MELLFIQNQNIQFWITSVLSALIWQYICLIKLRIYLFSDSENKAGRKQKGEGKGVFCRRGEGGGAGTKMEEETFWLSTLILLLIWSMPYFCCNYLIDKVLVIRMMMIFLFPPFVWQKREEGAPRDSALRCFTLLYGPPRSRLTSTHCAASSSSLEISDSGASKLSDVPLLMQEGRKELAPENTNFSSGQIQYSQTHKSIVAPWTNGREGRTNFWFYKLSQKRFDINRL